MGVLHGRSSLQKKEGWEEGDRRERARVSPEFCGGSGGGEDDEEEEGATAGEEGGGGA